jgi:ribose transport system permease protein
MSIEAETSAVTKASGQGSAPGPEDPGGRRVKLPGAGGLKFGRFSGIYVWILFIAIYAIWVPHTFLRGSTAQGIASTQAITGFAALGVTCSLAAGALDLSFASTISLSSTLAASLLADHHFGVIPVIFLMLGLGVVIGLINGFFVVKVGVSSIVATLGMSSVIIAVEEKIGNEQFITGIPSSFTKLTTAQPLGIPIVFLYLLVAAALVWYLLEHTPVGRRIYATGANIEASRLAGIATGQMTVFGLIASGVLASVAGLVVVSQIGSGSPEVGSGYLLPVFAAVFLGATQVRPGRFNAWGTILAIFLLATGVKGLQLAGGQAWVTDLFNGIALLLAVSAAVIGHRRGRIG